MRMLLAFVVGSVFGAYCEVRAIYLSVYELKEETCKMDGKRKQKSWCKQCMEGGNGVPLKEWKESSYKEKNEEEVTKSYGNNSYERKEKSWHYEIKNEEVNGAYLIVEGKVVEYDEGLE